MLQKLHSSSGKKKKKDDDDDALLDAEIAKRAVTLTPEELIRILKQHPPSHASVHAAHPEKTNAEIAEFRALDIVAAVDVFWEAPAIKAILAKKHTTAEDGKQLLAPTTSLLEALWHLSNPEAMEGEPNTSEVDQKLRMVTVEPGDPTHPVLNPPGG